MSSYELNQKVKEYVCTQFNCDVVSCKPETELSDMGLSATIWNVKTDGEGDWWVVTSDRMPMNLYPQSAYYFGTDEVLSFHLGLMSRLSAKNDESFKDEIENISNGTELFNEIRRKLELIAEKVGKLLRVKKYKLLESCAEKH